MHRYLPPFILCLFVVASLNVSAQSIKSEKLSEADRLYGLSHIWSEAKYNLVYFDKVKLDWDSLYKATIPQVIAAKETKAYYDVLRHFTAQLQDGHTSVWYPNSFYKNEFTYAPLATDLVQGKVFITDLWNDTLVQQGLEKGLEVLKVNGWEVHEYARKNLYAYEGASTPQGLDMMVYKLYLLNGPVDEPLKLTVKDKKGNIKEHTVSRKLKKSEPPVMQFSVLENNVGVLTINGFTAPDFYKRFDSLYPALLKTKALIIDVRNNVGGNGSQGIYMLKHFTKAPFPDPLISARQYNPLLKAWGQTTTAFYSISPDVNKPFTDRAIYEKPIAVLIAKPTYSAGEDFAMQFDYINRGPLIGQPSGGSTGQPLLSALPGGGTFRVCVRKDTYPDGKEFVGVGLQPDILVPENAEAFRKGEDLVMKKALEVFK